MRIFLVAGHGYLNNVDTDLHKNYLTSYYTIRGDKPDHLEAWSEMIQKREFSILLDSGAFSAWKRDISISVDDYIEFVKKYEAAFWNYVTLDVKSTKSISVEESIRQTKENTRIMEDAGLNPVPVYHGVNRRIDVLEELLEKYDFIFIGGLAGENRAVALQSIADIWEVNSKPQYRKRLHALGYTSTFNLLSYPWYSADSTAWLSAMQFHDLQLKYTLSKGRQLAKDNLIRKMWFYPFKSLINEDLASKYLLPASMFDKEDKKGWKSRIEAMVNVYHYLENIITRMWEERGVIWE